MKKKIAAALLGAMMVCGNAFAMAFSQPEKIGVAGCPDQAPYGGFDIEGASSNEGEYYTKDDGKNPGKNHRTYGKGIARFGNGKDALYCRYNYYTNPKLMEFEGKDNYIVSLSWPKRRITKITSDEGLTLYTLLYGFHDSNCVIIGRREDGTWTKYIDTATIDENFFGKNLFYTDKPHYETNISCQGDTIILPYRLPKDKSTGEFRFKWDDAAQWFGVEQVVY